MIRLAGKDILRFKWLYLLVVALFVVANTVMIGLLETYQNVRQAADSFYDEHNLNSAVAYGSDLTPQMVSALTEVDGVASAEGVFEADLSVVLPQGQRRTLRAQTMSGDIDLLYVYSGSPDGGIAVSQKFLDANDLRVGDVVQATRGGPVVDLAVEAGVTSPASVFAIKSWNEPSPDGQYFADAYLDPDALPGLGVPAGSINKVMLVLADGVEIETVAGSVREILGQVRLVPRADQISYITVEEETGDLSTVSVFFILVFMVCITSMLIVLARRIVDSRKKMIAYLRSLGTGPGRIGRMLTVPYLVAALVALPLAAPAAYAVLRTMLDVYLGVFYLPSAPVRLHASSIAVAVGFSLVAVAVAYVYQVRAVARIRVPQVLKGEQELSPVRMRHVGRRLPFPIRLAVRSAVRSPGRSSFVVLATVLSFVLLSTSFFFFDALSHSLGSRVDQVNQYDYRLAFQRPVDRAQADQMLSGRQFRLSERRPVDLVAGGDRVQSVVERIDGLADVLDLRDTHGSRVVVAPDSVVIPERYASQLGLGRGDLVEVEYQDDTGGAAVRRLPITDVAVQYTSFAVLVGADVMRDLVPSEAFTGAYVTDADRDAAQTLEEVDNVALVEASDYIYDSYAGIIAGVQQFAYIILILSLVVLASILLGILYVAVSTRRKEFAIMRMLGSRTTATAGRLLLEINLLVVAGLVVGGLVTVPLKQLLSDTFSNNRISFLPFLEPTSYMIIIVGLLAVSNLMFVAFIRRISTIDLKRELTGH